MSRIINSMNQYFRIHDLVDEFYRVVYNCNCPAPKEGKSKHYKYCRSLNNKPPTPKDYAEKSRGYKEYPREVVSIFVHFEIAAQDYVRDYGKVSDKTLSKRIDKARREAFDKVMELAGSEPQLAHSKEAPQLTKEED